MATNHQTNKTTIAEARKKKEVVFPPEYTSFVEKYKDQKVSSPQLHEYVACLKSLNAISQREISQTIKDIGEENISEDKLQKLNNNLSGLQRMKFSSDVARFIRYFGNIFSYTQQVRDNPKTSKRQTTPTATTQVAQEPPTEQQSTSLPQEIVSWVDLWNKQNDMFQESVMLLMNNDITLNSFNSSKLYNMFSRAEPGYYNMRHYAQNATNSLMNIKDYFTKNIKNLDPADYRHLTSLVKKVSRANGKGLFDLGNIHSMIKATKALKKLFKKISSYCGSKEFYKTEATPEYYPDSLKQLIAFADPFILGEKTIRTSSYWSMDLDSDDSSKLKRLMRAALKDLHDKALDVLKTHDIPAHKRDALESLAKKTQSGMSFTTDQAGFNKIKLRFISMLEKIHNIEVSTPRLESERVDNINGIAIINYSKEDTALEFWNDIILECKKVWDKTFGNHLSAEELFKINVYISDKQLAKKTHMATYFHARTTTTQKEESKIAVRGTGFVGNNDKCVWIFIHEICHKLWYEHNISGVEKRTSEVQKAMQTWERAQRNYISRTKGTSKTHKNDLLTVYDFVMAMFMRFPTWYSKTQLTEFFPEFISACCYYVGYDKNPSELHYLDLDLIRDVYYPLGLYIMGGDTAFVKTASNNIQQSKVFKSIEQDYKEKQPQEFMQKYIQLYEMFDVNKIDKSR